MASDGPRVGVPAYFTTRSIKPAETAIRSTVAGADRYRAWWRRDGGGAGWDIILIGHHSGLIRSSRRSVPSTAVITEA